jgi:uncharacterized membrane protein
MATTRKKASSPTAATNRHKKPTTSTQEQTTVPEVQNSEPYRQDPPDDNAMERLALGLGWFSIGLGLTQILAPRPLARMIGVDDRPRSRTTMRMLGMREFASGVGILTRPQKADWLRARVAGDVMDLALLGLALGSSRSERGRVAMATAAVAGVTALDVVASRRLAPTNGNAARSRANRSIHVVQTVTINRPVNEVYRFWHDFENLPRFMAHLESVQVTEQRRSHWKVKAPAGRFVEWDAEITEDRPDELIAWRSVEPADIPNSGVVQFRPAPGNRGTEVRVDLRYEPPAGTLGAAIAKIFGEEPGQQVKGDLRRFKQVMETGEVVHSDASIHPGRHPAQPSSTPTPMAGAPSPSTEGVP